MTATWSRIRSLAETAGACPTCDRIVVDLEPLAPATCRSRADMLERDAAEVEPWQRETIVCSSSRVVVASTNLVCGGGSPAFQEAIAARR